jgi:hypothetical protein
MNTPALAAAAFAAATASCLPAFAQPAPPASPPALPAPQPMPAGPGPALPPTPLAGLDYTAPFFPGARYDANVPTPDSVLGFPVGSRPAAHAEIESVVRAIAARSPRVKLVEYARSHEGRALYYALITSPERLKNADALKADYAKLADPRKAPAAEVDKLVDTLPALAWMAYVIHGDEMSGSDASLALLHHLAASQDQDVAALLDQVVVVIDPLMNPDGRDRWITALRQNRTRQPQVDDQALLHTGAWPSGRMNHYLFDMNRDWIFATQPETRGRIAAVRDWSPHYFMESHEMGSQDTFLFMPARQAINHHHAPTTQKWVGVFGREQAAAFDARGWRYYTGEWNDDWYPGYSSSWAGLRGSVQNLYEQAAISTDAVRRPEGSLEPYREAVHKQLVSSMANLSTLAKNRRAVLADFVAERRAVLGDQSPYAKRAYAIVPSANTARLHAFLDLLAIQGFEFARAQQAFATDATDRLGRPLKAVAFPAGTIIVPNRQPLARLLAAMLEFDPRMTSDYLTTERRELLRFSRSKIYDITGWSIPMLFDLDAFELPDFDPAQAKAEPWSLAQAAASLAPAQANPLPDSPVGYALQGDDDRAPAAAARLMELGVIVRASTKPTALGDSTLPRGSIFILKKDNAHTKVDLPAALQSVSNDLRLRPVALATGWGEGDLPDLGGENFLLLTQPRVAVLGREPTSPYSFGQAWYTLDHTLGLRASFIDFQNLQPLDLRRYNVLVIPEGAGAKLHDVVPTLKSWTEAGGTLIAIADSAAALTSDKGLGSTRTLEDALTKPEPFLQAVIREYHALTTTATGTIGYDFTPRTGESAVEFPWDGATSEEKLSDDELKRRDEWRKIFMPQGAVLAARADDRSYLTAGTTDRDQLVPVLYNGSTVLLATAGNAPLRLGVFNPAPEPPATAKPAPSKPDAAKPDPAKPDHADKADKAEKPDDKPAKPKPGWSIAPPGQELRLRMSGLLWPEAADRLANTAYLTREPLGSGQVILFAADPNFRAATLGTSRLFINAVVLGPGMGTSQPIKP